MTEPVGGNGGPKIPEELPQPTSQGSPEQFQEKLRPLSAFEKKLVADWGFTPAEAQKFSDNMVNALIQQAQKDIKKMHKAIKRMSPDEEDNDNY